MPFFTGTGALLSSVVHTHTGTGLLPTWVVSVYSKSGTGALPTSVVLTYTGTGLLPTSVVPVYSKSGA